MWIVFAAVFVVGVLVSRSNPQSDLEEGRRVRIKYHPKMKGNARLVCKEHPTKPTFKEDNRS